MTENEAIRELKEAIDCCTSGEDEHFREALGMGILALEEIQQYRAYKEIFETLFSKEALEVLSDKEEFGKWLERGRWITKRCDEINRELETYRAIGTVEEFKDLKEKETPKQPDYEGDGCYNGQIVLDTWICPNCEKHYEVDYDDYDYCPNCGQHIDHSGLTEDD